MPRIRLFFVIFFCVLPVHCQDGATAPDDLIKQAQAAHEAKRYGESIRLYLRALPLLQDSDRADQEYDLAGVEALAGDRRSAFETLRRAIEDGYTNRKDTETDKDLVSLHADARWQPLLDRMTTFAAQEELHWGDAAFSTPNTANISDVDKLAGLAELWAQARFGFANFWHVPKLDWDKTYRDFIPKVLATKTTTEYYRVLQIFYALLEDGHTSVYPPELLEGKISRLPLRTRIVEGHLLIVGTRDPAADFQGLRPGDEIVTINSELATSWAQHHVEPTVSASTLQDRQTRTYEYSLFSAPIGTTFHLGTQTPAGKKSSHVFKVTRNPPQHISLFDLKWLPGNIAYVALNGFDDDTAAEQWDVHWPEISKASSLILDLRENGGGSDSVGSHVMATLIDKATPGELSRSTRWIATYRAWGNAEVPLRFPVDTLQPDTARHYSRPTIMLISPRTYSAGEDMVVMFTQAHRGDTIGESTGGSTGQPLMFKLPGGGSARVCTKHDSFADGREFVGVGIEPDVPVHVSREDIIAGRDPVLEKAVQRLQTKPQ